VPLAMAAVRMAILLSPFLYLKCFFFYLADFFCLSLADFFFLGIIDEEYEDE